MKPHVNTLLYGLRLPENNLRDISQVEIKVVFRGIIVMLVFFKTTLSPSMKEKRNRK